LTFDRILFASGNRHKFQEVSALFLPLGMEILFGGDLFDLDVEESGQNYSENAIIKARAWTQVSGLPCLADDSGLEIKALEWWPGIFSARVAKGAEERNELVLSRMESISDRTCRYVASFALVFPENSSLWLTHGICWGTISRQPSGEGGFGYDPLFIPRGYEGTFAELDPEVKASISHRSRAASGILDMLSSSSVIK